MKRVLVGLAAACLFSGHASAETYIQATLGGASKAASETPYIASGTFGRHLSDNVALELDVSLSLGDAFGNIVIDDTQSFTPEQEQAELLSSSLMVTRFISLSRGLLCADFYLKTGLTYHGFNSDKDWTDPLKLRIGPSFGMGFRYGLKEDSDFIADLTHVDGDNRLSFGVSRSF